MDCYIVVEISETEKSLPISEVTCFRVPKKDVEHILREISSVTKYGFFTAYLSDTPVGIEQEDDGELYHLVDWIQDQGRWTYVSIPEYGWFHAKNPQKILRGLEKLGIKGAKEEISRGMMDGQEEEKVYALMGRLLVE